MKILVGLVATVAALVIGLTTYIGIFPGLSDVLGTNKPKDLGMEYSQEKWDEGLEKADVEFKNLPENSKISLRYEGSHVVKDKFSDEILTSHAWNKDWAHYPVKDVQVRINDDGTCEVSGIVKLTQMEGFLSSMGVSMEDYKKALDSVGIPMMDLPFYAKGYGEARDNNLDSTVTAFKIGKFSVPQNIIDDYQDEVESFGEMIMRNIDGFYVNEARFEDNSIYFDGTLPDVEYTVPAN